MNDIYNRDYYLRHLSYAGSDTEVRLNEFRASLVLEHGLAHVPESMRVTGANPVGLVVDYGCSHGAFLKTMSQYGIDTIGVDINPYCTAHATNEGSKAFTTDMFDYFYGEASNIAVMTFWDVIEHIPNPQGLLAQFKPKVICASLPCLDGWQESHPNTDLQLWRHWRPNEHLWWFGVDTFTCYLKNCGYSVVYSTFDESKIRINPEIGEKNIMSFVAVRK